MTSPALDQKAAEALIKKHRLHTGLYMRAGKKLGIDPSYVSRVVNGQRKSERVLTHVLKELRRIEDGA